MLKMVVITLFLWVMAGCSTPVETQMSELQIPSDAPRNGQIQLENVSLFSKKVEILIPKGFKVMSKEDAKLKYPSDNRPNLIYTDATGSINVAFSNTSNKVSNDKITETKSQMKAAFENVYPEATWYKDDVIKIHDKQVGYFELLTPGMDTEIYNLIFFAELNGKLFMTTVNCKKDQMDKWRPIASEIMKSIQFN
ncbi:MAG: hypothetical protein JWM44_190 [Bacilli bacterium]|nr:hypothetical protein [Bacilli bacterium]